MEYKNTSVQFEIIVENSELYVELVLIYVMQVYIPKYVKTFRMKLNKVK